MEDSIKYFLVVAFAIFASTGLAVGYIASYFLLRTVAYLSPWLPEWMWYADISLYIHAVALAATSTVGIIAIFAKKAHAIKLCSYILAGLVFVEMAVTVQTASRRASLDYTLTSYLHNSMAISQSYYSSNISDTQMWDEIQLEGNCCGIATYRDWFSTEFGKGVSVPDSCCLLVTKGCGQDIASKTSPEDDIITTGCLPTLMGSIRGQFKEYGRSIWLPVLGIQTILEIREIRHYLYLEGPRRPDNSPKKRTNKTQVLILLFLHHKISFAPRYYPYIISPSSLLRNSPKYEHLQEAF